MQEVCPGLCHRHECGISFLERPGPGPTVVFLHGIGSNAHSFELLLARMPAFLRLIAWNAPGYRDSEPLPVPRPKAADYAEALERLLDALNLDRVHVLGHSLGTLIAAAFGERAPGRIASLTLAASAQGHGIADGEPLGAKAAQRLEDFAKLGGGGFARSRAPRLVFEPEKNASVVARVEREMARIDPQGYPQAVHTLATGNLAQSVARLTIEPRFIVGAEDEITPIDQTDGAVAAWAKVHGETPRVISIPAAGHATYVQAPQQFAEALQDLVPELRGPTPMTAEGAPDGR